MCFELTWENLNRTAVEAEIAMSGQPISPLAVERRCSLNFGRCFHDPPEMHAMIPVTLPAWIYANDEFFALEREAIFLKTWQLVGHVSELKQPGDFLRFDLLGESAIVLRDKQGRLQAFHNVCRHRAYRLLDGDSGNC